MLPIGSIAAARSLADEALDRANAVARAFAAMAGVEAREASLPDWFFLDDEEFEDELDEDFDEIEVDDAAPDTSSRSTS